MGKAKITGLIIDRREVGNVGTFDDMTDEELVEEARRSQALNWALPVRERSRTTIRSGK